MNIQTIEIPFDEQLMPARTLTTGSLTCLYEYGKLRYIKSGESEVMRMIYFAVRNEDWQTAPYTIEKESILEKANGFSIAYTALHHLNAVQYKVDVTIDAVDNSISFSVKGEALGSFKRNRIGICVLHPIQEYSGKEVIIIRPDDTAYTAPFPELISPHQPFKQIKKIACTIEENIKAECTFEGDIFETEDQRNWSDSSYKTYSTPLDIPFPVQVNVGEIVEQKMQLNVALNQPGNQPEIPVKKEIKIPFPKIGYSRNPFESLSKEDIFLLKEIPFEHYRVELLLYHEGWQQVLDDAVQQALQIQTKLELILFFSDDFEKLFTQFLFSVEKISDLIYSVLILQQGHKTTPVSLLESAYKKCKEKWPHISVGYGTDGHFADLNRDRPDSLLFDFVSFSLTPQAHASDTRSLIENLERQADLINTARSFAAGKQIHVSAVTFKPRVVAGETNEPLPDYDPRQHTSFGAFWTLCALKNLSDAQCLTFYMARGYRGILNQQKGPVILSPLYHLLKEIKRFKPIWIIDNNLASKPFTEAIVLENEAGHRREYKITAYP